MRGWLCGSVCRGVPGSEDRLRTVCAHTWRAWFHLGPECGQWRPLEGWFSPVSVHQDFRSRDAVDGAFRQTRSCSPSGGWKSKLTVPRPCGLLRPLPSEQLPLAESSRYRRGVLAPGPPTPVPRAGELPHTHPGRGHGHSDNSPA